VNLFTRRQPNFRSPQEPAALQGFDPANVGSGSKGDIVSDQDRVGFTTETEHWVAHQSRGLGGACPFLGFGSFHVMGAKCDDAGVERLTAIDH
jgi:hypothetical protein